MPKFAYEALDARGRVVSGTVEAPDLETVIEDLKTSRYTVTNIKQQSDILSYAREIARKLQRVSLYALAVFTRQFAVLFNAGLPITRGLDALSKQTMSKKLGYAVMAVSHDIKSGFSLSKAMSKHPDVFSPVYISLVKAGEMAGALGEVLDRLAGLMEKENTLRKKVAASMVYPIFVFVFSIIVTLGLVFYIFPKFIAIFQGIDIEMPACTKFLIFITEGILNPLIFFPTVGGVVVLGFLAMQFAKTPLGKRQKDRILLELPLIGKINKKVILSRFCRTLGTLISSGVPVVHSLEIVSRAAGNEVVSGIIDEIKMALKAGMRLSQPIQENRLFPPIVGHMVAVGEETGNLPILLEKLAHYYDTEVEYALTGFASMIEPIMIFVLGGMVGFVLISVFLPIYQLVSKF
ncbi:MAG: type II secretion system F family protein [Candidatus Eremiobacteraeota bacterium]|nr:type II secretion system F family protein [Candidatus Eremiobacteraeota bacterium]